MSITFTFFDLNNCECEITFPQTIRVGTGSCLFEDVVDVSEIDATPNYITIDSEDVFDALAENLGSRAPSFTKAELIKALGITTEDVEKAEAEAKKAEAERKRAFDGVW